MATACCRAKTSGSSCPFDQLSPIILKRCPILRTVLHRIITQCWIQKKIPQCWKKAATILIFKKGDTSDPSNFRPITLQPVWYKICASVMKKRMYDFLVENNYIDRSIQKGFWPKTDGVTEHTELLTHIMKDAKRNGRSLTVVLLDLRNAFGEIQHDLIRSALKYHHLPSIFTDLFNEIYNGASITVAVNSKWTECLQVNKGVLQGDPCSPLFFNLCFNTLMQTLKNEKLKNLGYIWGPENKTNECQWLQFADDAVIVTNGNKEAQTLLDIFMAWIRWSRMEVRLDKCCAFGMTKSKRLVVQTEPSLFINSQKIPSVALGESFVYLGKIFDFEMKNKSAKTSIVHKLTGLLEITSSLKIKPQLKLKILKHYIYSQLSFELRLYDFSETWISQQLDNLCTNRIREWTEMPISGCVKEITSLPKELTGLGIPSLLSTHQKLWLGKRSTLKNSHHSPIQQIWNDSKGKHSKADSLLNENDNIKAAQNHSKSTKSKKLNPTFSP